MLKRREWFKQVLGLAVAAPVVAAASASKRSLPKDTLTMQLEHHYRYGDLRVGDQFTISGHYARNPISNKPTGLLQKFTVISQTNGGVAFVPDPRVFGGRNG